MKKVQAIILTLVLLLTAAGCSPSVPGANPALKLTGVVYTDVPGVEVRIQEVGVEEDGTFLNVVWSNQTEYSVMYGEPYTVERLVDGQWVGTSKYAEGATFTAIGYMLLAGQEQTKGYRVSWLFDISAPGTYRFKTACYVEIPEEADKECTLWAVFTVGDDIPR